MDAATKTGQDTAKAASEKEVHKTVEATGELIWNKIAEKSVKRTPVPEVFSRNSYSTRKKWGTLNKLRKVLKNGILQNI